MVGSLPFKLSNYNTLADRAIALMMKKVIIKFVPGWAVSKQDLEEVSDECHILQGLLLLMTML